MKVKGDPLFQLIMAMMIFLVVSFPFALYTIVKLNSERVVELVEIRSKIERCKTKDTCKFLIMTDKGVFENTDSLINFKFNSSDVFNELQVGGTYNLTVNGWRVPFMSWYPNIVSYKSNKQD